MRNASGHVGLTRLRRRPITVIATTLRLSMLTGLFVVGAVIYHWYSASTRVLAINQTFTVTTTADSGPGSLRQAIIDANAASTTAANPNLIQFAIAGSGVQTIALQTSLPSISQPVIIDGTTQPGTTCGNLVPDAPYGTNTPHTLMVEILSSSQVTGSNATDTLTLMPTADGSTIKGLVVDGQKNGAYANDIVVKSPNTTMTCNYLGVKPDGVTPSDATTNGRTFVGETADSFVFSNNLSTGITASGNSSDRLNDIKIQNNIFGLKVTLDAVLMPAGTAGPATLVNLSFTTNALVGGSLANSNVMGGTGVNADHAFRQGITVADGAQDTVIKSNYVGITPTGVKVRNSVGIGISAGSTPVTNTIVGGENPGEGNFVSGNSTGIWIYYGLKDGVTIEGNYIGSGLDGKTSGVGNENDGISTSFGESRNFQIGGATAGARNVIAGNGGTGIRSTSNSLPTQGASYIQGNYIGVGSDGNVLANAMGISLDHGGWTIGGSNAGEGNIISGNNGAAISWDTTDTQSRYIYGNIIGLKPDGETPAPNVIWGTLDLRNSSPLVIGGTGQYDGNIIAGNTGTAIVMISVNNVTIKGNKVGVTKSGAAAGNGGAGINASDYYWQGNSNITIGGDMAAEGNVIAYNATGGVLLSASNSIVKNNIIRNNSGTGVSVTVDRNGGINNVIRQNSIHTNTGPYNLGIDLSNDGITANDALDSDTGANTLQNYPVITASITKCDGTTDTHNVPMFSSTPNTTFTIDYYANPSWDPASGLPRQGEQWVSSQTVTTDAQGNATLTIPNGIVAPSVTATDPNGNTSEFGAINTMVFAQCQDMLQRVVNSTSQDFSLNATWTGTTIPNSFYRNYPTWNGSQYVDNPQKAGLTVTVTVGGVAFGPTEPLTQWQQAYSVGDYGWSAQGHTATPLPDGVYDVAITVTDPTTGLTMTTTYPHAVKVVTPTVTYTTTFTNNATPTLHGSAQGTTTLFAAYILPAGTPLDTNTDKPRALLYVPDRDSNGNQLDTGTFQVITNQTQYITALTQYYATNAAIQQANWTRNFASWYLSDLVTNPASITTLTDLKATCSAVAVQQRIQSWWGVSITNQTDCENWFQQQYDAIKTSFDQDLQTQIAAVNNGTSGLDFSALPQGTYDLYFTGLDLSYTPFSPTFPGGLVVDFTTPSVTLTTTQSTHVSPELNGTVSDPSATVVVRVLGTDYTAHNNGDGTWTLPTGTIQGGLGAGTYTVVVTVTSLAGNTSTETKTLTIVLGASTTNSDQSHLADTGSSVGVVVVVAGGLIGGGVATILRRRYL